MTTHVPPYFNLVSQQTHFVSFLLNAVWMTIFLLITVQCICFSSIKSVRYNFAWFSFNHLFFCLSKQKRKSKKVRPVFWLFNFQTIVFFAISLYVLLFTLSAVGKHHAADLRLLIIFGVDRSNSTLPILSGLTIGDQQTVHRLWWIRRRRDNVTGIEYTALHLTGWFSVDQWTRTHVRQANASGHEIDTIRTDDEAKNTRPDRISCPTTSARIVDKVEENARSTESSDFNHRKPRNTLNPSGGPGVVMTAQVVHTVTR